MRLNEEQSGLQQILNTLNPQCIVEENDGTAVLSKNVGTYTISVRGFQPERICVYVLVQGGRDMSLVQGYGFFKDNVTDICDCLNTLMDRYQNRRN